MPIMTRRSTGDIPPDVASLPVGAQVFYLTEGGANVIYRIELPPGSSNATRSRFVGKLLRLRKAIRSSRPCVDAVRDFHTWIYPLFDPDTLVNQTLIRLPPNFITRCNEGLRRLEGQGRRPSTRRGIYLQEHEPFGMLVTDMTASPRSGEDALMWEFKPKWLLQSPSAPHCSKRCRTCALWQMKKESTPSILSKRNFCPMDLISNNFEDVLAATRCIAMSNLEAEAENPNSDYTSPFRFQSPAELEDVIRTFAHLLHRNPVLQKLQARQQEMQAVGLLGKHSKAQDRAISMALRDCTMLVRVSRRRREICYKDDSDINFFKRKRRRTMDVLHKSRDEYGDTNTCSIEDCGSWNIDVRLCDLDLKTGDGGKLEYWRKMEKRLIDEGWYSGDTSTDDRVGSYGCALERDLPSWQKGTAIQAGKSSIRTSSCPTTTTAGQPSSAFRTSSSCPTPTTVTANTTASGTCGERMFGFNSFSMQSTAR